MSDDDKTKTQGTVLGALTGAVVGGGIGALTGLMTGQGRAEDIIIGAIVGGMAGGVAGGVVGYQHGVEVARRKAQYRSSEEFYVSQIQEIDATTQQMKKVNANLSQEVRYLSQRRHELDQALAMGAVNVQAYRQELSSIRRHAGGLQRQMKPATDLVNYQRAVLQDAENTGTSPQIYQELQRAGAAQEEAYAPLEKNLHQLDQVGQPTRG